MTQTILPSEKVFCTSWSGGKDACFAHWKAMESGSKPACIFTMLKEEGEQTGAHGLHREVLKAQAECLGLPVVFGQAGFQDYREALFGVVEKCEKRFGINRLVFGDIDLLAHKEWYEEVFKESLVKPDFPIWQYGREQLLKDLFALNIKTMIVSLKPESLDKKFLGQILTPSLANEIRSRGVCPTGEDGEFHTLVLDAPCFHHPLKIKKSGVKEDQWGYLQLQVMPC